MLRRLFVQVGFPWAVRALTFVMLGCLAVCCAVMRPRPRPCRASALLDFRHFRDLSYMVFVAGQLTPSSDMDSIQFTYIW